jgi:hypothetical protein
MIAFIFIVAILGSALAAASIQWGVDSRELGLH